MDSIKFTRLYDKDIEASIRNLIEEGSYLKTKIFKSFIGAEELNSNIPKAYKKFAKDFVETWENYANDLQDKIRSAEGRSGIRTIDYQYAKDFIYNKDDYASMLQFTDGVINGIKSGKFDEPDNIEDFFKFTVTKAFHDRGESVAALLDSSLMHGNDIDIVTTSDHDGNMFNTIRKYNMFNSNDKRELTKSIDKLVDVIINDMDDFMRDIKRNNIKMFVSMVNNIIEYMTYSLAAYATRIYVISAYAYPFINNSEDNGIAQVNESGNNELSDSEIAVTIMHDANELVCRDPVKFKEFSAILDNFVSAIGADHLFGPNKPKPTDWVSTDLLSNDNTFASQLIGNSLYEYLIDGCHCESLAHEIAEMNNVLKEFIYNNAQSIETTSSPRQEMLHVIRGAKCNNTINGYQILVKDMYVIARVLLCRISGMIKNVYNLRCTEIDYPRYNTTATNDLTENYKMLTELYHDLSIAFLHKAKDIEMQYNKLKKSQINSIENELSIKIPNDKCDLSSNDNMMNAVPDTTRLPMDLMDIYDLPTFESLEMYDEYLRTLPGLEDDPYLCEAGGISNLINAILSRLSSIGKRFKAFFNDERVKKAIKWTIDNEQTLMALDFNGKQMTVLPLKKDVSLPKGYDKLSKNLQAFNDNSVKTEEDREKFIKSLYPSDVVYGWFINSETKANGPEMYRNYILFDLAENQVTEKIPESKTIDGNTIHEYMRNWINTMRNANDTLNGIDRVNTSITNGVDHVKSVIVSIENTNKQKAIDETKANPPATPTSNPTSNPTGNGNNSTEQSATEPAPLKEENNKTNNNVPVVSVNDTLLADINITIDRLWGSMYRILIDSYFLKEYKYIKEAYSIGRNINK